jgi:hypothetical protein
MKHWTKMLFATVVIAMAAGFPARANDGGKDSRSPSSHADGSSKTVLESPRIDLPVLERGVFIRPIADLSLLSKTEFKVLPRVSHINITVDGVARREMVILYSLDPGPHKVLIELTDRDQSVVASQTVDITLPDLRSPGAANTPTAEPSTNR